MKITVLAGGIGGARFLSGVVSQLDADSHLTIIGNTADDIVLHGLRISPDLDSVMYTLGGGADLERGWGRRDETYTMAEEFAAYGVGPDWFTLGDRDLATHVVRTRMLGSGFSLSEVTAALCARWFADLPNVSLVPMADEQVATHVVIADDTADDATGGERAIHFQEWWVRHHAAIEARRFVLAGIDNATPAPGVLDAIASADVVLLAPSNPVVSIGPILSVPGIREALRATAAPVVGLSPIIGGAAVRGMADACLGAIGVDVTAEAVGGLYADFLDGWLVDTVDAPAAFSPDGQRVRAVPLYMSDAEATGAMVDSALSFAEELRGAKASR